MIKAIAILVAFVAILHPVPTQAALVLTSTPQSTSSGTPMNCSTGWESRPSGSTCRGKITPVSSASATTTATTTKLVIQVPVITKAQTKAERAEQIAQLNALLKELKSLLAAIQAAK